MDISLTLIQWLLISLLASGCPARAAETPNSEFLILKSSLNSLPCSQHSHSHSLCEAPTAEAQTQVIFSSLLKIREADIKLGLKWCVHSRKLRAHPQVVWGMAQTQMTQHNRCSLYLSDSAQRVLWSKSFYGKAQAKARWGKQSPVDSRQPWLRLSDGGAVHCFWGQECKMCTLKIKNNPPVQSLW